MEVLEYCACSHCSRVNGKKETCFTADEARTHDFSKDETDCDPLTELPVIGVSSQFRQAVSSSHANCETSLVYVDMKTV